MLLLQLIRRESGVQQRLSVVYIKSSIEVSSFRWSQDGAAELNLLVTVASVGSLQQALVGTRNLAAAKGTK